MRFVDLDPGDIRLAGDAFPVLAELRTELTAEALEAVYAEGHPQGLRFTAAYDDTGRCLGVAGWRVMATTATLRKLYVDDLVTAAAARSAGVGSALLTELVQRARAAGCAVLDLDSGVHRADAHRFYFRERMAITALHFTRPLV
ncbi:MAG: GNAT family N-acetyltransferase [Actinomycetota bacterium]|nr:GNAT family N-acetyltransferase [Actinomycetota bacterium]